MNQIRTFLVGQNGPSNLCCLGITMENPSHAALVMPVYMQSLKSYIQDGDKEIDFLQSLKFIFQCATGYDFLIIYDS